MNSGEPLFYKHRVLESFQSIQEGQSTTRDGFHQIRDILADHNRENLDTKRSLHADSQNQSSQQHADQMQAHRNLRDALIRTEWAMRESSEAVVDAVDLARHEIGYRLDRTNHTLDELLLKQSEICNWLESVAGMAATLVEILTHQREVEALEVANHARASMAIGRLDEGLRLAEDAYGLCPTSVLVNGHLILALYAQGEAMDRSRVATLITELGHLIKYRMVDAETDLDILAREAAVIIPPILHAASRTGVPEKFDSIEVLLDLSIVALIYDNILLDKHLLSMCDTPSAMRDYFWWQSYHAALNPKTSKLSDDRWLVSTIQFFDAINISATPLRFELELQSARMITEQGFLEDLLLQWIQAPTPALVNCINGWQRHQLPEVADHVALPASLVLIRFARRHNEQIDNSVTESLRTLNHRHDQAKEVLYSLAQTAREEIDQERSSFLGQLKHLGNEFAEYLEKRETTTQSVLELEQQQKDLEDQASKLQKRLPSSEKVDDDCWFPNLSLLAPPILFILFWIISANSQALTFRRAQALALVSLAVLLSWAIIHDRASKPIIRSKRADLRALEEREDHIRDEIKSLKRSLLDQRESLINRLDALVQLMEEQIQSIGDSFQLELTQTATHCFGQFAEHFQSERENLENTYLFILSKEEAVEECRVAAKNLRSSL